MQKLSLSMIIKNEEKFLKGCLESVAGLVDEIVIADTGSVDSSRAIAQSFGAKFLDFPWIDDFSAARNFSLQHCTGDWILYLDADERLAAGQGDAIRKLIADPSVAAYNVMIENPHSLHQGSVAQENSYPRLFRRLKGVQFEGRVHEQIWHSLVRLNLNVRQSSLVIYHLGYDQGYDVVRQKAERNLFLLQHQLEEQPDDAYAQFQVGSTLVVLRRYDEALPVLEHAIANEKLHRSNRASCHNLLAEVEVQKKNLPGAVEHCLKSVQLAPGQLMAHWFLSFLYFDLREFNKAVRSLQNVEQLLHVTSAKRSHQIASDLHLTQNDVHKRLAITYEAAGNYIEAIDHYLKWVDHSSKSEEAFAGFANCALKLDDSHLALEKLNSLTRKNPERTEMYFPLAFHYKRLNDIGAALKFIDMTINAKPEFAPAYALASRWRVEIGDIEETERLFVRADQYQLRFFDLHKIRMELALKRGNIDEAFRQLDLMTQTTDADLSPLRIRLSVLASRITSTHPS